MDRLSASIHSMLHPYGRRQTLVGSPESRNFQYIEDDFLLQFVAKHSALVRECPFPVPVACDGWIFSEERVIVVSQGLSCVHDQHFSPVRYFVVLAHGKG